MEGLTRMAYLIKGINIMLYERVQTGVDGFNRPVYTDSKTTVKNVLVTPVNADDVTAENNLTEKHAVYELSIPKNDNHIWEDRVVEFFGQRWHTVGIPLRLIPGNVPLDWDQIVKVERYG